jgi:hypothetical protein
MASLRLRLFFVRSYYSWLCFALGRYHLLNATASVAGDDINASSAAAASVAHATISSPPSPYTDGTDVLTSTAPSSSSATSILPSSPSPPASLTTSSTSSGSVPASSALTNLTDPDLLILAPRRIDFIIAQQSGANSLSSWFVYSP